MSSSEPAFDKVPSKVNYVELERAILERWAREDTFNKLREKNAGGPTYSFLDGPITANNPMGVHHAWGRTYKDAFQRYRAMRGHELRYQNGFDCQGLWVEVEVQKEFGLNSKDDILAFGLDKFVAECKKRVLKFAARITRQSWRLGYWMQWDRPEELEKLAAALADNEEVTYTAANGTVETDRAEKLVARLGCPEWGGSYFTFSTNNNETIWTFLKKCHERGKIEKGHDVMPWSGRTGSAYSQMEISDGRKLTTHESVFVRFPLKDRENEFLLVWTTTPWTLTSNVVAAVNPELDYVKLRAKKDGALYYFAKDNLEHKRLEKEFKEGFGKAEWTWPKGVPKLKTLAQMFKEQGGYEDEGSIKGAEMVGWEYTGPFDDLPAQNQAGGSPINEALGEVTGAGSHKVVDGGRDNRGKANVVAGEGTGIVHIAPGCGDVDHKLGAKLGLPVIAPLGEDGCFQEGFGDFTGMEAIDPRTPKLVFEKLREKGYLFATETYPHVYPHCWRNKDELVFRLVDEWFINMNWRQEIIDVTKTIDWLPADMKGEDREAEWLTNMGDWMISKKRFWGLALPFWVDEESGDFEVIGSLAELKERAVEGWEALEGHSPHRPHIDKVKIKNPKTGNLMTRIQDVGNPWLDAGIVPFSTMYYNEDRERWQKWFPADFITECFPGQFRNWFYALLSMGTMMAGERPFKTILGHGLVRDEDGEEMHKSAGNSIPFDHAANQLGADTMRWMYAAQSAATNLNFGKPTGEIDPVTGTPKITSSLAERVRGKVFDTLWNTYAFFCNYARLDGYRPGAQEPIPLKERPDIDRWAVSNLALLVQSAPQAFESYDLAPFMERAGAFIDELSNWYVRRNRRRFWKGEAGPNKQAAYDTLHTCLITLCKLLAPAVPFLTEELYAGLRCGSGPQSVHLCDYPEPDLAAIDEALSKEMDAASQLVKMGRSVRTANKLRTRQPLKTMTIVSGEPVVLRAAETMAEHIREELKVKSLEVMSEAGSLVDYSIQPNLPRLGPRYGKKLGKIRKALGQADAAALARASKAGEAFELDLGDEKIALEPEDVLVRFQWSEGYTGAEESGTLVALDTRLTPELEREGLANDLIRHLQELRKKKGLDIVDRITIAADASDAPKLGAAVGEWKETITGEVLCTDWKDGIEGGESEPLKIGEEELRVQLSKA